jgi:hypothetical protein
MGGACSTNGEKMNGCRILVGKPEGRRPLGRTRRRWGDTITVYLKEIGLGGIDLIELAYDRNQWRALVNTVINLRVPYNFGNFLSSCTTGGFSTRAQLHGVSYHSRCSWIIFEVDKTISFRTLFQLISNS